MNEWKTVRLGDYITEYSVKNKNCEDIPVYSVTNTQGFCTEYFSKDVSSKDKSNYKIVPRGYFAYNPSRINVGSVDWQRYEDRVIVSPLYNVFGVSNELDNQYLYYFIKSDFGNHLIKSKAEGSVRDNLKLSMLSEFPIPMPPLAEQKHIAAILDKTQKIIAEHKQMLQKYDTLIKSRFIEMFGDNNFQKKKWNEIFITKTGKLDSNAMVEDGEYPFFTCAKEVFKIDKYAFDQEALLLAGNNAAGKYDVKHYKGKFNAYQRTYVLSLKEEWEYPLFKYQLEDKLEYLRQQSLGGLTKYLTLKILETLDFIVPPIELQKEFSTFVQQIDKSKSAVQKSLEKTETLYKSLMQQYFG